MEALRIEHLNKQYEGFGLKDINISLPIGSIMGFIGENGAGKSTTMKTMLDLVHKDSGEVYFFGKPYSEKDREIKERIGVVMEEACFSEDMTAEDICRSMRFIYQNWKENTFWNYMDRFRIERKKKVKVYSKGMRMKLSIAVALSHESQLLILDEATSGLDPIIRDSILDLFYEFIQNEQNSILISSHILSDLEKACDYVTLIEGGRILFSENKDILMEKHRILKGKKEEIEILPKKMVIGIKENYFGAEALVRLDNGRNGRLPGNFVSEQAKMEEIMLYYAQAEKKKRGTF